MQQKTMNLLSHLRNLKNSLILIPIGFVIAAFNYLITDGDNMVIYIFVGGYFLFLIPVILIHSNYFKIDKNKQITILNSPDLVEIIDNGKRTKIEIGEILRVILTSGLDGNGYSIWSSYFFYQIDLKNGQTFFITSLLIKPKDFPFKVDLKRHTAFPIAKHFDPEREKEQKQIRKKKDDEALISRFYKKYSDYSLEKLKEIIENKTIYDNSAVKAAERLINEKITVANTASKIIR